MNGWEPKWIKVTQKFWENRKVSINFWNRKSYQKFSENRKSYPKTKALEGKSKKEVIDASDFVLQFVIMLFHFQVEFVLLAPTCAQDI